MPSHLVLFCALQLVPCEFNHPINSLGRLLDPTSSSNDVSTLVSSNSSCSNVCGWRPVLCTTVQPVLSVFVIVTVYFSTVLQARIRCFYHTA